MVEFYQAYATYEDFMALTEDMLSSLAVAIFGDTKFPYQGETVDFTPPWERLTVAQAVARHGDVPEERLATRRSSGRWPGASGSRTRPPRRRGTS